MAKVSTGLKGLDKLLDGGYPGNTAILLSGGPGTGKTLNGLSFLMEGAAKKERCCYISLSENEGELVRACKNLESLADVEKYLGKNLIVKNIELGETHDMQFFTDIFKDYPDVDRLVIDNVNKLFISARDSRDYRLQLSRLVNLLKAKVKCSLLICETVNDDIDAGNGEAFECDGVVQIMFSGMEERPRRILQIHKMRYTPFAPMVKYELMIDNKGMRLSGVRII